MASIDKKALINYFNTLEDDIILQLLQYLPANDLISISLAWKYVAFNFMPNHPIVWKKLFLHHWQLRNFALVPNAADCTELHPTLLKSFSGYVYSHFLQSKIHSFITILLQFSPLSDIARVVYSSF